MDARGDVERRLVAAGQGHLLAHASALPAPARDVFLAEAASVPWEEVIAASGRPGAPPPPDLRPPEALTLRRQRNEPGFASRLAAVGNALLAEGRVATALLSGGQGTRLGHGGPKGTFVLGPTPDRTLFRILVERVVAAGRRAGRGVPLVVLTGPDTDVPTREAFRREASYGHDPALVTFVRQSSLPALDDRGRALLSAPGRLALSPDGHGGLVPALERDGVLEVLAARGVEWLTTFQVDNPLARPLDPVFLGWAASRRAVAAGKAVRRTVPDEKVGVFGRDLAGRVRVVEYSEAPPGGYPDLVLGSIALHAFSVPWLRSLRAAAGPTLPLHRARKRVAYLDDLGNAVEPAEPNATKLERFLFDLLPLAPRVAVQEVERAREFAPVKNAAGADSPATARALVAAEVVRWHREAGRPPPEEPGAIRPLEVDGPEDLSPTPA